VPGDDLFKRYLELGATVLGVSRERAEGIVRDLVASGEVAKGQATKAADWLVERSRASTEELAELVRREIRQQVVALGLATKDDVAGLRAELDELRAAGGPTAPAKKAPAKKAAAKKVPAKRAAARNAPTAAASAPPAPTKSAGITRPGSVRKRPAGAGSPTAAPGTVPPAGGADSAKG
jgi:polyhydroxyalkanoate synthesis regulator phasin